MFGLNRLKSFFTENDNDHELSIHDLLLGNMDSVSDKSDYHLKSISSMEASEDHVVSNVPSPVHENIAYAEERLAQLMGENEKKARDTLKIIESLDCTSKTSWTDVVNRQSDINK